MSRSRDEMIQYFQNVTSWQDRQKVVDYLRTYDWNVNLAIESFMQRPAPQNNDTKRPSAIHTKPGEPGKSSTAPSDKYHYKDGNAPAPKSENYGVYPAKSVDNRQPKTNTSNNIAPDASRFYRPSSNLSNSSAHSLNAHNSNDVVRRSPYLERGSFNSQYDNSVIKSNSDEKLMRPFAHDIRPSNSNRSQPNPSNNNDVRSHMNIRPDQKNISKTPVPNSHSTTYYPHSSPTPQNTLTQRRSPSDVEYFTNEVSHLFRPQNNNSPSNTLTDEKINNSKRELLLYIDKNIIGRDIVLNTPWGSRKMIYADYTASGRGLNFIEDYMLKNVLPYYANTHSEHTICAKQTTKFREGARALIKQCVNATEDDALIFTGSGSTAAINKLVDVLQLREPEIKQTTVVFVSAFDHHSNILPWKETGVETVRITINGHGLIDKDFLAKKLKQYHNELKKKIVCTFNAASNVTGIRTDVDQISALVHQHDGLIFWDYAAAAPYVKIDMNPSNGAYKDAVFISTHKFVGGPATPGILIAKKKLFTNTVPTDVGGGTVKYVTRTNIEYVKDIETREEGGTPNILGAIRCGLVFQLKNSVGEETIEHRENALVARFLARFRGHKHLLLLGPKDKSRLAIFSFLIYMPPYRKYLHHNFICVLLNDLFGIQVRSGCSCAGPYVLDLLDIDDRTAETFMKFISADESGQFEKIPKIELMKPGFTRFNLSYFASDQEVDYILDAVEFIANEGWRFLPLYTYELDTAVWHARTMSTGTSFSKFHDIEMITYKRGVMEEQSGIRTASAADSSVPLFKIHTRSTKPIDQARAMAQTIQRFVYDHVDFRSDPPLNIPPAYRDFIWFVLPKEVIRYMIVEYDKRASHLPTTVPFRPKN